MENDEVVGVNGDSVVSCGQKQVVVEGGNNGDVARLGKGNNNGLIPSSFRTLSGCLRVVSSGASNVVRSAASAASAIVERESESSYDQVYCAGFDKLDCEEGTSKRVLLLGHRYGFQVFDVEEIDNVHTLDSRYDGPVSFMQILPKPVLCKKSTDRFAENRPLLMIGTDGSFLGGGNLGGSPSSHNGSLQQSSVSANRCFIPTVVWFYSLKSQTYVHLLKFRSVVHLVRCSSRVVAVLQGSQIHCFDTATLEREYTILTNPVMDFPGSGGLGVGPLAVGPRWMAYSGSPVVIANPARVSSQHLPSTASFSSSASNGSLVAHYAKESSKHLAAGIVTLGDIGIKKISRYYSELVPDNNNPQSGSTSVRVQGVANGHSVDADSVGMVIVRDTVSKTVITQFKAHKSPISSLCFNPSGTLLVTASVQGHNINVFRILPGLSSGSAGADPGSSYVHLYRLQRGLTNAVIQDISFSNDSRWILVSSSKGTSHLFDISPSGGPLSSIYADTSTNERSEGSSVMSKNVPRRHLNPRPHVFYQQNVCAPAPPVTLSAVNRIRSGSTRWRNSLSSATAVACGKTSSASGAIASAFYGCSDIEVHTNSSSLKTDCDLLVFSPSGFLIQYAVRRHSEPDSLTTFSGVEAFHEPGFDSESRLSVEAVQKWNICQKPNLKELGDNLDIYGQNGYSHSSKVFPERMKRENDAYSGIRSTMTKHKLASEEMHHLYMSEAELQTHQAWTPLWANSEIYFQSMIWDGFGIKSDNGEVEIEKMPTHNIEVRSKDLVPAYGYFQTPMFQKGSRRNNNGSIFGLRSDESEKVSSQAGVKSVDSMITTDFFKGTGETGFPGLQMPREKVKGSVYTDISDSPIANT
ncbi:hypothetical protein LIER_19198 [Lithospermum erythrorhizon]|uniref:BCAS3 domain-containing protein n=1 Tax=Lithospermum erythrorhizon TaxID=34254 RepID=A0AAV3QHV4_LITER